MSNMGLFFCQLTAQDVTHRSYLFSTISQLYRFFFFTCHTLVSEWWPFRTTSYITNAFFPLVAHPCQKFDFFFSADSQLMMPHVTHGLFAPVAHLCQEYMTFFSVNSGSCARHTSLILFFPVSSNSTSHSITVPFPPLARPRPRQKGDFFPVNSLLMVSHITEAFYPPTHNSCILSSFSFLFYFFMYCP
jgi:hypothetical protein